MNDIVHKAMNNANCIYTLTFTFLLSSSPTSGERRGGDGCSVSNGHFFGRRAENFLWGHRDTIVISEDVGILVTTRDEKTAPPKKHDFHHQAFIGDMTCENWHKLALSEESHEFLGEQSFLCMTFGLLFIHELLLDWRLHQEM